MKTSTEKKVSSPISWKPNLKTFNAMQAWLEKNPAFDRSLLLDMAISKFVQEDHVLHAVEIVEADSKDVLRAATRAMKKHKAALDRLK